MNEKIALGLGNNIDYEIVWNSQVIENLIIQYDIRADELAANRVVNSERDLVISILNFLKSGTGGERFVASSAIIEQFAQNFAIKITLGGTSVRAAMTRASSARSSTLGTMSAARTPMMTSTTMSSIRVKPAWMLRRARDLRVVMSGV